MSGIGVGGAGGALLRIADAFAEIEKQVGTDKARDLIQNVIPEMKAQTARQADSFSVAGTDNRLRNAKTGEVGAGVAAEGTPGARPSAAQQNPNRTGAGTWAPGSPEADVLDANETRAAAPTADDAREVLGDAVDSRQGAPDAAAAAAATAAAPAAPPAPTGFTHVADYHVSRANQESAAAAKAGTPWSAEKLAERTEQLRQVGEEHGGYFRIDPHAAAGEFAARIKNLTGHELSSDRVGQIGNAFNAFLTSTSAGSDESGLIRTGRGLGLAGSAVENAARLAGGEGVQAGAGVAGVAQAVASAVGGAGRGGESAAASMGTGALGLIGKVAIGAGLIGVVGSLAGRVLNPTSSLIPGSGGNPLIMGLGSLAAAGGGVALLGGAASALMGGGGGAGGGLGFFGSLAGAAASPALASMTGGVGGSLFYGALGIQNRISTLIGRQAELKNDAELTGALLAYRKGKISFDMLLFKFGEACRKDSQEKITQAMERYNRMKLQEKHEKETEKMSGTLGGLGGILGGVAGLAVGAATGGIGLVAAPMIGQALGSMVGGGAGKAVGAVTGLPLQNAPGEKAQDTQAIAFEIQFLMSQYKEMMELTSNIMKMRHDVGMTIINNTR